MGTKLKLCACGKPRDEHRTIAGSKGRNGEPDTPRQANACPGLATSFKLANPVIDVSGTKANNNPPHTPLLTYALEMFGGEWHRKLRCPCCMQHLPPFFSTAGLKQNQGHTKDVDCECGSKIHKPEGWKWGQELDVKYNALADSKKMKQEAAMKKMAGGTP